MGNSLVTVLTLKGNLEYVTLRKGMPNPPTATVECWKFFILDGCSNVASSWDLNNNASMKRFFYSEESPDSKELLNAPSFTVADIQHSTILKC